MTVRLWRGRVGNTIVRIMARAGVAQPVAGLGAGEAGAGRVALGSAGRGQVVGRGTVAQAGVVERALEAGANRTKCAVAPIRAGAVEAEAQYNVCHPRTARQGHFNFAQKGHFYFALPHTICHVDNTCFQPYNMYKLYSLYTGDRNAKHNHKKRRGAG